MDRPFSSFSRPQAGRRLATRVTCAVLLFGGCQESSQVSQHHQDASAGSAVPQRFHAPEDIRPVAQLASHLEISEAEEHVVVNPYAGLNRFPPVINRSRATTPAPVSSHATPAFDHLKLPFRLEKSASSENMAPSRQAEPFLEPPTQEPVATSPPPRQTPPEELGPANLPLQLNPPRQAAASPQPATVAAAAPTEKQSGKQFLATLEPEVPAPRRELALPEPPNQPRVDQPWLSQASQPDLGELSVSGPQQNAPAPGTTTLDDEGLALEWAANQRSGNGRAANDQASDEPTTARKPEHWGEETPADNPALAQQQPQPQPAAVSSSFVKFRGETPQSTFEPIDLGTEQSVLEGPARPLPGDRDSMFFPPQMRPITTVEQGPTAEDRALFAVRGRMNSLVDRGLILAQRGAYFSARAEFIQALRLATQTLDTAQSTHRHSEALAEAIAALEEAGDFIPSGAQLEANVDLELVISSHRTTILRETDPRNLTALTAAQSYFALAQEKLALACGGLPEASRALVGLGRIQEHLYDTTGDNRTLIVPRSMALYQSALVVHGKNFEAANELGVMLARYGQFEDAKQALLQGAEASSRPEIWRNLASIHETLGETDLANRARLEAEHALQFAQAQSKLDAVRWISPEEMAAHGRGDTGLKKAPPRSADSETPVAQKRPTAPWWAR